jgi:TolA-binding protein
MMKALCSLMFFNHKKCKNEVHHELIQLQKDNDIKILSLEAQIVQHINQIQELKAINHYQAWELEKKIAELKEQLDKKSKKGEDE